MKNKILTLIVMLLSAVYTYSQAPEAFNYQAIARNGSGVLLANQSLDIRIGIYSGVGAAVQEYEETHTVTTNQYGQFALKIGQGTVTVGSFSAMLWGADEFHVKVEVDPGTGYIDLGTTRLISVPYALYAAKADIAGPWLKNGGAVYYNSGYIGIGTSNPGAGITLESNAGYGSAVSLKNTGGGLEWRLTSWTDGSFRLVKTTGTTFSPIVVESTNGWVGMGTSSPGNMLHIKQKDANKGLRIEHQSTGDYWENGVGTTTKNYKFYYNNLFRADISSTDGAYTQSSDRRLKHNLVYMGPVLERVMLLKPATYNYIDNDKDAVRSTGFIAQEVQQVFPNLVREMEDGYSGVVYDGFAVISIRAIQELNDEVQTLKSEMDQLKKDIEVLKAQNK